MGRWHQTADARATLSQGNRELLVGELVHGMCCFFPSVLLTLLVGRQVEHSACKKLGVGLLVVTI